MSSKKTAVGFISAPGWLDPAPDEFRELTRGTVAVQQTFLDLPNFDYQTESIAGCEPQLTHAALNLAGAGCSLIASPATPFGFVGHENISEARARLMRIEQACGVECLSSIAAIIEALEAWQIRKVALACTYYPDEWRDSWSAFVSNSGFEVLSAASLVDQEIVEPDQSGAVVYPTPEQICEAVSKMAADCPAADVIVVSGAGARTLAITEELRAISGKRIIAADTGLFRAICERLEIDVSLTL